MLNFLKLSCLVIVKIIYQNFCQLSFGEAGFTAVELVERQCGCGIAYRASDAGLFRFGISPDDATGLH